MVFPECDDHDQYIYQHDQYIYQHNQHEHINKLINVNFNVNQHVDDDNIIRRDMNIYLYNPEAGAKVHDVWIYDVFYFDSKKEEELHPGDVVAMEEKPARYLLELYEFLIEVTPEKAQELLLESKKTKIVCKTCGKEFRTQSFYDEHVRSHVAADGVRVASGIPKQSEERKAVEDNNIKNIESEATAAGLTGEGLVDERTGRNLSA